MILGRLAQTNLPLPTTTTGTIERVTSFKLLGVYIDSSLSWTTHINNITKKATRRLYFLKQLKRAGLTINQLLHYYTVVIRPVIEYCAPAWHYALTKTQTEQLEALQPPAEITFPLKVFDKISLLSPSSPPSTQRTLYHLKT